MANYDPNDPRRTDATDPHRPNVKVETHVEPVERRASPLPLIIGILLALAIVYFVLQYFMARDEAATTTGEEPAAVTTTAPAETTTEAPAAATDAPVAAPAEAAAESAANAASDAATAAENAASDAATAAENAAEAAGQAVGNDEQHAHADDRHRHVVDPARLLP